MQTSTTGANLKVDGATIFASYPDTTFHFVLKLKRERIYIWLKDHKSKKQWQSGFLALSEFITRDNTISGATLEQYVRCFKTALEEPLVEDSTNPKRELIRMRGDKMKLKIVAHLQWLETVWSLAYAFTLTPIAIEHIAILNSKLLDVEEEVHADRSQTPMVTEFEVKEKVVLTLDFSKHCKWEPTTTGVSEAFAVHEDKCIRAKMPGMYMIGLRVKYVARSHGALIWSKKENKEWFRWTAPFCSRGVVNTMCRHWVTFIKKDEGLEFFGDEVTIHPGTKMVITRVGY